METRQQYRERLRNSGKKKSPYKIVYQEVTRKSRAGVDHKKFIPVVVLNKEQI